MRAVALVLAGCGRVAFDPNADAGLADTALDAGLPRCISDDFIDGLGDGWLDDAGQWEIQAGRSDWGWGTPLDSPPSFTAPRPIVAFGELDLVFDVKVANRSTGDLFMQLISGDGTYQVSLYPIGSDNMFDRITQTTPPMQTLASTGHIIPASPGDAWSRIRLLFAAGQFRVLVDDVLHLEAQDSAFVPPFDLQIGLQFGGTLDNITVHCR